MKVSNRLWGLKQSALGAMTVRCQELGALNLAQGLSQVPPPASLLADGARDFKDIGHSYSQPEGLAVFRDAVSDKVRRSSGLSVDPATEVLATVGATGALMATLTALLDAGDHVILFEPFYSNYLSSLKMLHLHPEPVRLVGPDFVLTEKPLRAAINGRTRAMIICSPNNPSGHRLTAEELDIVAAVAEEHDLLVIADEVYEDIYFGPTPHLAAAAVASLKERTVTLGSLAKSFSVPGWRLGYVCGPALLISAIRIAADALVVCAPAPLQELGSRALKLGEDYYHNLRAMYDRKRRTLAEGFAAAGLSPNEPEGSYYLFVDCSRMGVTTGMEAAEILLEKSLVGTVPGESFYVTAPDRPYIRACFSLPDDVIDEAVSRLVNGV